MNKTEFVQDVCSGFLALQERYSGYSEFDSAVLVRDSETCFSVWFDILWYRVSVKQSLNQDGTRSVITSCCRCSNTQNIVYLQAEDSTTKVFLDTFPEQFCEYLRCIGNVVDVLDEFVKERVLHRSIFFPPDAEAQSLVSWNNYIIYEDVQQNIFGVDADIVRVHGGDILVHYWLDEDFHTDGFVTEEFLNESWADYWNQYMPDYVES